MHDQAISDNEIYLLIKYIKSVLWRVAKCLSYIEEARCLKVKMAAWHSLGGNEEDHKMPVRQSMTLSRLEPGTSRV